MQANPDENAKKIDEEAEGISSGALKNYLHLDDARGYVQEIVVENMQEYEGEQDAQEERMQEELSEMRKFVQEQINNLQENVDDQIGQLKKRTKEKMNMQDDVIEQISCELHKEAKKKSDQQLEFA